MVGGGGGGRLVYRGLKGKGLRVSGLGSWGGGGGDRYLGNLKEA